MELLHAAIVVVALLGLRHNLVVRSLRPASEAAQGTLPWDNDAAA